MFERYSDRARQVVFLSRWSAEKRGGLYIEPEDLLRALIWEDRGEFPAILAEISPGTRAPVTVSHHRFFDEDVAADLLQQLQKDTSVLSIQAGGASRQPAPPSICRFPILWHVS